MVVKKIVRNKNKDNDDLENVDPDLKKKLKLIEKAFK